MVFMTRCVLLHRIEHHVGLGVDRFFMNVPVGAALHLFAVTLGAYSTLCYVPVKEGKCRQAH